MYKCFTICKLKAMKKILFSLLLAVISVGVMSCKSEQDKAEDLIDEYMLNSAYDYESYKPIKTEVRKCNRSIWSNINAIQTAKVVIDEFNQTHTSFDCIDGYDKYDVYDLIKKHKSNFGDSENFEKDHYDGYTIDQKFRIKSRGGYSNIVKMRFIVDNDFENIIEYYELPEDYAHTLSVGYILNSLFDLVRSGEY